MSGPFVWLDRANEILVRARLGGRQPVPVGALPDRADFALGEGGAPLRPRLEPARGGRGEERWSDPPRGWHARRWPATRAAPGHPAVILLHPWMAIPLHLRVYRWLASPLLRAGVDLWVPTLPEHMERAEPGRASGERCVSADLGRTAAALRAGVDEAIGLVRWLRRRGAGSVCLWGVSLGGWVGALAATATGDLDAVVLWEPVAQPELTLRESGLAAEVREALRLAGIPPAALQGVLGELSPAGRALRVDRRRVLLIAGRRDTVVPASAVRCLGRRWGVATTWLEHAHIGLAASPTARRISNAFLLRHAGVDDA